MGTLLAKSPYPGQPPITLLQHTLDVMNAAETLFGSAEQPTRLGQEWLRFFKIGQDHYRVFWINLQASAAFHDWGKANSGFLDAVQGKGEQVIRHEHLSALLLALDTVSQWLARCEGLDVDLVLSAVLSHHLKANITSFATQQSRRNGFHILPGHEELMEAATERLELSRPIPSLPTSSFWGFPGIRGTLHPGQFNLVQHRERVKDYRLRKLDLALRTNGIRQRLLWAVRAALIAADAVGSGLPRVGQQDIIPWIEQTFAETRLCSADDIGKVIYKRFEELRQRGKFVKWDDFQLAAAQLPSRALLLAPCGSGKTLAAWRWIEEQVRNKPTAHVLFLYPTRGTAKEGFRDYVSWAPEADAALMHGTSAFDLQGMFTNPDDPRFENRYEVDRRLFALGFWTKRIFSATVDQFLAFMQYGYGPMCMLPILADSVLVIDEVHSFDRAMFSALKEFLNHFDLPVLCMTATLPNVRRAELENECKLTVYDDKQGDMRNMALAPRYRLQQTTQLEARERIREALDKGRRVLWVVNQVKRAQQAAVALACDFRPDSEQDRLHVRPSIPLLCYHSRFRLKDRVKRHEEVVTAFRTGQPAALAITTQVCQMSLDMDADLLVSEWCPISDLIQRMGRCNRERWPRPLPYSGEVLVYEPEDPLPYDAGALTGVRQFLAELARRHEINQEDLEKALAAAPAPPAVGDALCSFTKSGAYAMGGEEDFRDSEELSIQAVLERDGLAFLTAQKDQRPGFVIPVPRKLAKKAAPGFPSYLQMTLDTHYHLAIGFCDQELAKMGECT